MNTERLSGEFNRGYTRAIMDLQEIFEYIQPDLKAHHKNLNGRLARMLLSCCLENREALREKRTGFIRYDGQSHAFEYYQNKPGGS